MNRSTKNSFMTIQGAAVTYQIAVTEALKRYESEKSTAAAEASQYKDEASRLSAMTAALKANARNAIARAEKTFTGIVTNELDSIRNELAAHLLTAPSQQFISTLALYRDFHVTPSKAEINALLKMAGGGTLALRCLNSLLDATKAGYTVTFPSSEDFESDLDALERLSHGFFCYSPVELHSTAVEVYGGQPVTYVRPDGSTYQDGSTIDSIRLITNRTFFESAVKSLDGASERWTDNVIPSVQQLNTDIYPEGDKGKEEYEADRRTIADAAQIEKETVLPDSLRPSRNEKAYAEVISNYLR